MGRGLSAAVVIAIVLLTVAAPASGRGSTPICDGKWREYPSNLGAPGNALLGAEVINTHDAWAVGYQQQGRARQPLIERWNGTDWGAIQAPSVDKGSARLADVDAITASDAWAVGRTNHGGSLGTFVAHWEGSAWSRMPAPSPPQSELNSVSMAASGDVWAVGTEAVTGRVETLAEHWDGTQWSVVPTPDPGARSAGLLSVSATSGTFAIAVGSRAAGNGSLTLVEQWDGTSWNWVQPSSSGILRGVWALKGIEAWAAGPPALHWDAGTWSDTTLPVGPVSLYGVSGRSATGVWAVGSRPGGAGASTATILRWNGDAWLKTPKVPSPGAGKNELLGVAASEPFVWTVGYTTEGAFQEAFILGVC
ncbi:MAG: hypothetical protein ABR600_08920 [Actinomycetota bacterium]